jgi:UPF0716 protein FxsA
MLLHLILLLTTVPIVELILLLQVHHLIAAHWGFGAGLLVTVGSIAGTGILGAALARHQGLGVLRDLRQSTSRGELPGRALADGVLILVGAALLLTPGFLTDAFGLSLLVPPTRALYRRSLLQWLRRKIERGEIHVHVSGMHTSGPESSDDVLDAEYTVHDQQRESKDGPSRASEI